MIRKNPEEKRRKMRKDNFINKENKFMKKIFSIIFIILCSFFAVSCSSSDNKKWFEFDININFKEVSNDVISNELSMAYVATKEAYESLDVKVEFDASGITVGVQEVPLIISGSNKYVSYALVDGRTSVEIQVVENE